MRNRGYACTLQILVQRFDSVQTTSGPSSMRAVTAASAESTDHASHTRLAELKEQVVGQPKRVKTDGLRMPCHGLKITPASHAARHPALICREHEPDLQRARGCLVHPRSFNIAAGRRT